MALSRSRTCSECPKNAKFEISIPHGINDLNFRKTKKNTGIAASCRLHSIVSKTPPFFPTLNRLEKRPQNRLYLQFRNPLDPSHIAEVWHSNCVWPFNCFSVPRGTFRQIAAHAAIAILRKPKFSTKYVFPFKTRKFVLLVRSQDCHLAFIIHLQKICLAAILWPRQSPAG